MADIASFLTRDIDGLQHGGFRSGQFGGAVAGFVSGKLFGGEHIIQDGKSFSLQSAAEELAFGIASKVESRTVRERNLAARQKPKLPAPHEVLARYRTLAPAEGGAEKLHETAQELTARLRQGRSWRPFLRERFADPSKRYLAVVQALHDAQERGASVGELEALHDLLAELERTEGASVRAGFNTADVAAEFEARHGDGDRFRKLYRDAVIGYESFFATVESVVTQFGEEHFLEGSQLLVKALAADLKAVECSTDKVRLNAILQDLYQLKTMLTLYEHCRRLITIAKSYVTEP